MSQNISYTFRKSAFDKPCQWTVVEEGLLCINQETGQQNTIPYKAMQSIRVQFQPYNRYRHNNYRCRIISAYGTTDILSTSYIGFAEFSDQAQAYTLFVKALVTKAKSAKPDCPIYIGQTSGAFYGNVALIVGAFATLYLLSGYLPLTGRLLSIILLLFGAWSYLKHSFQVNKPQQLMGDEIPACALPEIIPENKITS